MRKILAALKAWALEKSIGVMIFFALFWLVVIIVAIPLLYISYTENIYDFRDTDPTRGAATVTRDRFGDSFASIQYLDQGWKPEESLWYYTTTQGSDLLPYDLFMEVEQAGKTQLFRANENINDYRYLPQNSSKRNPEGLPVGFVKDTFRGTDYIGYSCAACHAGQINYNHIGIRIDGGPSSADLDTFINDLAIALDATQIDPDVRDRFVKRVIARGHYQTESEVLAALTKARQDLHLYNTVNASDTHYGFARLDAFGRIYNRVLEHVLTAAQFRELLKDIVPAEKLHAILGDGNNTLSGTQRDQIFAALTDDQLKKFMRQVTNEPNAPVSYPFLWDIPQHDYVQWNGLASNAGLGSVGRNTGEVIGVFGTLDWKRKKGFSISSLITGQGFKTHVSFESSVNVHNLRRIEAKLWKLQSPQWPENILPKIDHARAERGDKLFGEYCAACHSEMNRADPDRRVVAQMSSLDRVGTDRRMAENSVFRGGRSGILRNEYVALDAGSLLLDERAPAAALLTKATLGTVATPYPHDNIIKRGVDWAYDLIYAFTTNEIKPSLKGGNYDPDTSVEPLKSLFSYKARPLNGIWATSPYLHNGSVPTLYDLLLPKKRPGDPDEGEYRPDKFVVGSREFDPIKVGLRSEGYNGFEFDTNLNNGCNAEHHFTSGNCNAGHEYTSGHTAQPNGIILPALDKEARLDLLEYLKTL